MRRSPAARSPPNPPRRVVPRDALVAEHDVVALGASDGDGCAGLFALEREAHGSPTAGSYRRLEPRRAVVVVALLPRGTCIAPASQTSQSFGVEDRLHGRLGLARAGPSAVARSTR